MIKKIAWEAFKNTGDINTFLEYKQIEDLEKEMINKQINEEKSIENNGKYKNEGNNFIGT